MREMKPALHPSSLTKKSGQSSSQPRLRERGESHATAPEGAAAMETSLGPHDWRRR